MKMHPLIVLNERYPQLSLPVQPGMRETEQYKNAVLRGVPTGIAPQFSFSEKDSLTRVATPAGDAEVLYLSEREDFEHAVRALAYRCEPRAIPASMGASALSGLINWEKLRPHMGSEAEFEAFTADKSNYLDKLILLSSGNYSAVPAERMGLSEEEWREKSVTVRKYHELTHFTSGKLFPQNKEPIRDEIIADMIGLFAAFGEYDPFAAKMFLGTEGGEYRRGGRLENYAEGKDMGALMERANGLIGLLQEKTLPLAGEDVFEILQFVECNGIGLDSVNI